MARAAPRETKNLTNNLARRLYRNSSLKRLYSLSELKRSSNGSEVSLMTDINCSALVPSISLKKYSHVEKSRNEMEFFKGRILLKKLD